MKSNNGTRIIRGLMACAAISAAVVVNAASATAGELVGSWAGGGSISLSSGKRERASCRAHYAKTGATSYAMSASCATASARVDQTASLTRTGANSFAGSFFNQQYQTGGSISVTINGGSQNVTISGQAGSGSFNLRRL